MSLELRIAIIEAGFVGNSLLPRQHLHHLDAHIRSSSLRALYRLNELLSHELAEALTDPDADVRRTAVECSPSFTDVHIHQLLDDGDVFVAEMTAWALGERTEVTDIELQALITRTTTHSEAVVREACAAALGSLGDERGLPAILAACSDKPAVRRRAVLALAPFEGEEVDIALKNALEDRDWQVRQNAEILVNPRDLHA